MWMKKAEFGLGNKTIVGLCSNSLRNTNPRGRVPLIYIRGKLYYYTILFENIWEIGSALLKIAIDWNSGRLVIV